MRPTDRCCHQRLAEAPSGLEAFDIQAAAGGFREAQGQVPGPVRRRLDAAEHPRRETMKTNAAAAEREADVDQVAGRGPLAELRNLPQRAATEDRRCTPS